MKITRYARKPKMVEAVAWGGSPRTLKTLKAWANEWLTIHGDQVKWCGIILNPDDGLIILRDVQTHQVQVKDPEVFRELYGRA